MKVRDNAMSDSIHVEWVQWGRRHHFMGPLGLADRFDVRVHVAHSAPTVPLRLHGHVTIHRRWHALAYMARLFRPVEVDLKDFSYMDHYHRCVSSLIPPRGVLYSLANGYPLLTMSDARLKVHEQVACTATYALLRNRHQGSDFDVDTLMARETETFKSADLIICPSDHVAEYVRGLYAPAKTATVRYPIVAPGNCSPDASVRAERKTGKLDAVFAGVVQHLKGADTLFELARKHSGVNFHIAGDIAMSVPALPNVKCYGRLTHASLGRLFAASDVFLFPSMCEGSAFVAHEAFAMGLPGIVSRQAGSHYIDNLTGFVPDAHDLSRFSACLEFFDQNRDALGEFTRRVIAARSQYGVRQYQSLLLKTICDRLQ